MDDWLPQCAAVSSTWKVDGVGSSGCKGDRRSLAVEGSRVQVR